MGLYGPWTNVFSSLKFEFFPGVWQKTKLFCDFVLDPFPNEANFLRDVLFMIDEKMRTQFIVKLSFIRYKGSQKNPFFLGDLSQICLPTPGFLWDLGKGKVKFGSKKAIFGVIWGGFEGFVPCLGISHPTHPHLRKISQKKRNLFLAASLICLLCFTLLSRHTLQLDLVLNQELNAKWTLKKIGALLINGVFLSF